MDNENNEMNRQGNPYSEGRAEDHSYSGSGWAKVLKVLYWLAFGGFCVAAIGAFISVKDAVNAFVGILAGAAVIILAILFVGGMMVFLNMAKDINKIRWLLERRQK